jgi:NAD(P)-dependent dehydrogenase (short-subunit alcohol dehydrogenase family)
MKKPSRIFITGSADGLGQMAAQLLSEEGHTVVLHARNEARAKEARQAVPKAEACVIGDLSSIVAMKSVAEQANATGPFDAVIHNAAVGYREPKKILTEDGLPHVFAINSLAPYVLTALISKPRRLVYLSSGLHLSANTDLGDMLWESRGWSGSGAYSESKFHNVLLAFAVARLWTDVLSNALEPGWVATKMGGAGAPDDLDQAHRTQAWLCVSDDPLATKSGEYYFHQRLRSPNPEACNLAKQDHFLKRCAELTGVKTEAAEKAGR